MSSDKAVPFAYTAMDPSGEQYTCVAPTLERLCAALTPVLPYEVTAWYENGTAWRVPREEYAEPTVPTREEALDFIRRRAARIADSIARGSDGSVWRAMGCARCDCDDPEDKQVADYIATAPWRWRAALAAPLPCPPGRPVDE